MIARPSRPGETRVSFDASQALAFPGVRHVVQVAAKAGQDPVAFRMQLLPVGSREPGCLRLVAEKSGWLRPLAPTADGGRRGRRGRGVALAPAHRSYGAIVTEVTVNAQGAGYSIDRVVSALDCGLVINPDNVVSQMEGSVGFGLSMSRFGQIPLTDGVVDQNFFSDHHVTRMHIMPKVECHLVASRQGPSGASGPSPASWHRHWPTHWRWLPVGCRAVCR